MKRIVKVLLALAFVLGLVWFAAPMAIIFPALAASSALNRAYPEMCPTTPIIVDHPLGGIARGMTVTEAVDAFETELAQHQLAWRYLTIETPPEYIPPGHRVIDLDRHNVDSESLREDVVSIDHSQAQWDFRAPQQPWRIWCFGYERRGRVTFTANRVSRIAVYWEWAVYF